MEPSFTSKTLRISVILGKGVFSAEGNTKIIEGLATTVEVTKPGLPEKNSANVSITNMAYSDMQQLTMLAFRPLEYQRNYITIEAGTLGDTLSTVFKGAITAASADFNASPDVVMKIESDTGTLEQLIPEAALATTQSTSADNIFRNLANTMGFTYQNEGVTSSVTNSWFSGSPMDKAISLSRQIGCELLIDDNSLIVMPAGQARKGNAVYLDKNSGMVGYPVLNKDGIVVKSVYNPDFAYGSLIEVKSIVPGASGVWRITKIDHKLEAYCPGDNEWLSTVEAAYYG